MKALIFCRVSSKEQEDSGYSLPAQEKLLTEYSTQKNLEQIKIFSISESASGSKQRQVFDSMVKFANDNQVKAIVCEKVDRLTRNLKDAVGINDWLNQDGERQVHFVKENVVLNRDSRSNEKFIWNIKVSVAQYYIDNLSEEVRKGQKEKLSQGWIPTKPPLGYTSIGEKGRKIPVKNEDNYKLIQKMFTAYASGNYSLDSLTVEMFRIGLRNSSGTKVERSRVHHLLKERFYIGEIYWKGKHYPGKHEPIIEKNLFDAVQVRLSGKSYTAQAKIPHLFKGLMKCKECGGINSWETHKGIKYGHCNHYRNCSQKIWSKEVEVENQLLYVFDTFKFISPRLQEWVVKALKESHSEQMDLHRQTVDSLKKNLDSLNKRLDAIYEDKLDGKISLEYYQQKFDQYTKEKKELLDILDTKEKASDKYIQYGSKIFQICQNAKTKYIESEMNVKRKLLLLIFEEMTLDEGKLEFKFTEPFKLLNNVISKFNEGSKIQKMVENGGYGFELDELVDGTRKSGQLVATNPILLLR